VIAGCRACAQRLLLLAALLAAVSCTQVKELVRAEKSNAVAPTPLEEFEQSLQVDELWSERIGKGADEHYLKLTPIVAGSRLFVADRHGRLAATESDTGKTIWTIKDKNLQYTGGPGSGDGMVLMGTGDGRVIAREADTGKVRWVAKVSSEVLAAPRAGNGVTVVRTGDGRLVGLDSQTGKELWAYDRTVPTLSLRGVAAPVIDGDLVFAGFDNGRFAAFDVRTGRLVWESPLAVPSGRSDLERMVDVDAEPIVAGTVVYVASFQGGVTALSIVDGQIVWPREISSYEEISLGDGRVYVTDEEGVIWALDRESGSSVWKQEDLANRFVTAPVFFNGHVVVSDFEGYVHWLDAETGEFEHRAQIVEERIIAPAIAAGDMLLVYSISGHLTAMRPR
jgi:outer membrane protein assembly factor BamB